LKKILDSHETEPFFIMETLFFTTILVVGNLGLARSGNLRNLGLHHVQPTVTVAAPTDGPRTLLNENPAR
jgi:hypothetical protein